MICFTRWSTAGSWTRSRDLLQEEVVPDRVEVASQIDLDHGTHPPQETASDFRQRLMRRALRAKPVGVGTEVRLEDSFQDQLQCPLHHAVADARNLERSDFAFTLRDLHHPVGLRLIGSG